MTMVDENLKVLAAEMAATDTSEMDGKYLTFWTDGQLFGIPIADVVQIVGMQEVTQVPEFPAYAKGIINLRGEIIPIIDIRLRFGKPEIGYNERTCIIITSIKGVMVGIIVDSVNEVTSIQDEEISEPPHLTQSTENAYLTGVGKHEERVILLLDTQKILSMDQVDLLSSVQS